MNKGQGYFQTQIFQSLRNEYQAVEAGWRFFSGLRFAVLSFAATLQFGLFGGYQYVFTQVEVGKLKDIGYLALWTIPAFATIVTLVIALVERRAQTLYIICLERGTQIEELLGISRGHFWRISIASKIPHRRFPYTYIIRLIYAVLVFGWAYLLKRGLGL